MKKVKMKINPRIIEHLGSDLITSASIEFLINSTSASVAIVELIKNSIDARSKRVNIQFFDGVESVKSNDKLLVGLDDNVIAFLENDSASSEILLIEDIGIGMNEQQLQEGFLNVGTDIKLNDYKKTNLGENLNFHIMNLKKKQNHIQGCGY